MTRKYAIELYHDRVSDRACEVCGFLYVKELTDDRKLHRSFHNRTLSVFEPKPNKVLAKMHAKYGRYLRVTRESPTWIHKRLHYIATVLSRENGYSFIMWNEHGDDGPGYILTDGRGLALGGCALRWREWTNAPASWMLQWIWIAPPYRRQGLLRDTWLMLTSQYAGIMPESPFSLGMARFLLSLNNIPDNVKLHALSALGQT